MTNTSRSGCKYCIPNKRGNRKALIKNTKHIKTISTKG